VDRPVPGGPPETSKERRLSKLSIVLAPNATWGPSSAWARACPGRGLISLARCRLTEVASLLGWKAAAAERTKFRHVPSQDTCRACSPRASRPAVPGIGVTGYAWQVGIGPYGFGCSSARNVRGRSRTVSVHRIPRPSRPRRGWEDASLRLQLL
jgi:hypothetical protein